MRNEDTDITIPNDTIYNEKTKSGKEKKEISVDCHCCHSNGNDLFCAYVGVEREKGGGARRVPGISGHSGVLRTGICGDPW